MEESAAPAAGGPPRSIEVNKTGTSAGTAQPSASGQSTPTTVGTGSLLTTTTTGNVNNSTTNGAGTSSSLPPTVPYRSAGGLASDSPAAVMSAMTNANTGSGGASVSTLSPGSLAGHNNSSGGGGNNAVEFTARDAQALSTPDLSSGMTTPNPNATAARQGLSVSTSNNETRASSNGSAATSTSPTATNRPSPRSQTLRSSLSASRSTLHASLSSYAQTQNTHLESAFGALMQSIQEHTDELDVHQDNLDR